MRKFFKRIGAMIRYPFEYNKREKKKLAEFFKQYRENHIQEYSNETFKKDGKIVTDRAEQDRIRMELYKLREQMNKIEKSLMNINKEMIDIFDNEFFNKNK